MEKEFKNTVSQWPKKFKCRFAEPGVISYENVGAGIAYISKETWDKILPSFVGKPIVLEDEHKAGTEPKDFEKIAKGVITSAYYKPEDGWYWADYVVWDDEAARLSEKESPVSCTWKPTQSNRTGGKHNEISFDEEVLNGEGRHIALVPNPRYDGAKVYLNSKSGGTGMNFVFWKKKASQEKTNSVDTESAVEIDGAKVSLKELIETYKAEQAEIAKKGELEKEEINAETSIDIDGKDVKVGDMVSCYKNRKSKENSNDGCADCKGTGKIDGVNCTKCNGSGKMEKKNETEEEKKAKEAEEKKNADEKTKKEAEEKAKKEAEEKKNSLGKEKFVALKKIAEERKAKSVVTLDTVTDRRERGRAEYGSITK
jgi:hypothetical protein